MLATLRWWQFKHVDDNHVGSFSLQRIGHQHKPLPSSVTNIDAANFIDPWARLSGRFTEIGPRMSLKARGKTTFTLKKIYIQIIGLILSFLIDFWNR